MNLLAASVRLWVTCLVAGSLLVSSVAAKSFPHRFGEDYPRPLGDFVRIDVPLKKVGNLILIRAVVDSVEGDFILDTGAPYLILNSRYFKSYETDKEKVAHDITGDKKPVKSVVVDHFQIDNLYYEPMLADLADLSPVEELRGVRILGALGINLFLELELELNLAGRHLVIHRLGPDGSRLDPVVPEEEGVELYSLPFALENNVMLVTSEIAGQPLKFCFDTGAEAVVLGTRLPAELYRSSLQLAGCLELTGATGASRYVHYGRLSRIKFGREFRNVNVIVANLKGLERSYGEIDGIVGYDLLAEDVLCINFVKREITMKSLMKEDF